MRQYRPNPTDKTLPALSFVYDTLTASKLQCPPIFQVSKDSHSQEVVTRTGRGTYYKNVRNEWATLVATPPGAAFQDALAFTRSIGDLHLQTYGVSHLPDITWMDLLAYTVTPPGATAPESATVSGPIVLCASSDGVWDNWKFEDVSQFLLHPGRVEFALKHETSQACCVDLMQANLERARVNFGNSADNMTAVLAYMVPRKSKLPAAAGSTGVSGTGIDGEGDVKLGN
jgi:serine/threonine protein phosphatase PrpC